MTGSIVKDENGLDIRKQPSSSASNGTTSGIYSTEQNSYDTAKNHEDNNYKIELKWLNIFIFIYLHAAGFYGFMVSKKLSTHLIGWTIGILSGMGTTVGAHRYFTHRTFKATQKMKVLLMLLQTMAGQENVTRWARDHRIHHKFTDTNADPYNSSRGFFFSHIGWLMCKKHPDVKKFGSKVDMSDLENDKVLQFQKKYYAPMAVFFNLIMPIGLFCYFGESFSVAWHANIYRYILGLNLVWSVNSVAHIWGNRPYEKDISPTDSYLIGFAAFGEGWHNYHHCFPWDYKTSELPTYVVNFSTAFIDLFAWLGWATDLKTVPAHIIKNRVLRTGDGTHQISKLNKETLDSNNNNSNGEGDHDSLHYWGFGDEEITVADKKNIKVLHKSN